MKIAILLAVTVCVATSAYADFSYTIARKTQGSPAAAAAPSTTKYFYKGQRMMTDSGAAATIVDFDAQTITILNRTAQNYTVMKFSDLGQAAKATDIDAKIDVKETGEKKTGEKKTINGFSASEVVMTMEIDSPQMSQSGMKMPMEIDMWRSSDVPGAQEFKAFYQKNAARFPWAAMGSGGASGMQKAIADAQRKMADAGGVPLLQIVKVKSAGGGAQSAQMQQGMAQARAQMEAMIKQGGPGAAAAQQALARMGAASGGGALFETTMESTDFSTSGIPDSVFAIPAGYQKTERK
jgi:hypothetical protein